MKISKDSLIFQALIFAELFILFLFCLDIIFHVCGYGLIFLKDYWNLVDAAVILINIVFVVIDTNVNSQIVQQFLKLRGFFRLIRIFVLIRKVN